MTQSIPDLESLLQVPYFDPENGYDLSSDGTTVAFSWNRSGWWEVYLLPLDGSAPPRQLTAGPGAKSAPRWSPDGQYVAYALDADGGESYDIYVCDLVTGQHRNLTPGTPDAIQPDFCWSPDGRHIALISDRSGSFDTYLLSVAGGEIHKALESAFPDRTVRWSPDCRWLAVVSEAEGQDFATTVVSPDGIERHAVLDGDCAKDAAWSPDSQRLALASDQSGCYEIGVYELATRQVNWVTGGAGEKENPAWSSDGRRLAYVVSDGPLTRLELLMLETGAVSAYQIAPGVHTGPRLTPDGAHLLCLFDSPTHPCDLWLIPLNREAPRQLTYSLPARLAETPFVMPKLIRYPGLDGVAVPALLYRPPPSSSLPPAVVYVHGGPNWLTQMAWDPVVQHMVGRGWVVLAPNYRGSIGYGREWQLASRFDFGGVDTRDVAAGADYLVREGLANPTRIAVTGRSWGGYLTMTSLTQYPERWAAGSAVVPFLNWFTGHANSRKDLQHWDLENFGHPERDRDLYYERSPFFFLDRVQAPVQFICGAHDVRCPASESVQAARRTTGSGQSVRAIALSRRRAWVSQDRERHRRRIAPCRFSGAGIGTANRLTRRVEMVRLTVLTPDEIKAVHQATLCILSEVGVILTQPEARERLTGEGATLGGDRVLLPPDLVERLIAKCTGRVRVRGRNGETVVIGDGDLHWHNLGGARDIYDHRSGDKRPATLQDVVDSTRLLDAMESATTITPLFTPQDVPGEVMSLAMYRHSLPHTVKPLQGPGVLTAAEVQLAVEMAAVVGPPAEVLTLSVSPVSPLTFSDHVAESIMEIARHGISFAPLPCPTAGATAPLSLAGALTQQNAEALTSLILAQLIQPGLPVIYCGRLAMMEPRTVSSVWGGVELGLASAATVQIGHHYNLPVNVYGMSTNAHTLNLQSGFERALNSVVPALAGADELSGIGELEAGVLASLAQIVADNEIAAAVVRLRRGFSVDEDSLAVPVIASAMDGSRNFLDQIHTVRYLRAQEIMPTPLSDRRPWDLWNQDGRADMADRAQAEAERILATHEVPPLSVAQERELDRIMQAAAKTLANR